mmetsp:Transcript_25322/g.27658  ORF Transcript_25322/g.27658 Transcript_25322/m.27658 type:complete len:493 (-) Transcript_25322:670-2148(-)|eukprot:gene3497-3737_t
MIYFYEATTIIGIAFGVIILYYIFLYISLCWKYRHFKGPTAYPIVGNCFTPEALMLLKYLSNLRAKYGNVYTFFNFTKVMLVVCDAVVVRRVLSDPKTFYKGSDYSDKFGYIFGQGLVTANGDKHRRDRALFGKYFIRANLGKYAIKMNEIANKVIGDYFTVHGSAEAKSYNIEKVFARLTLRTFMNFAFSTDLSNDEKFEGEFCKWISDGSHAVGMSIMFNLPMWKMLPHVKTIDHCGVLCDKLLKEMVSKRRKQMQNGEITDDSIDDCIQAMIRTEMSDQEMFDHFITLISAGHDTTAFFISYTVYLLAQNPEVQTKLYNYLMERVGNRDTITADDFAEMKYLQCVMMETLRLYAIIPCVTRAVDEEIHIKERNITIPAGTNILIPMIIINRDPETWERPGEFRPERFEEKGNDFTSAKDGYFPFGYGVRTCIGNTFAQLESAIVLCKLMKLFEFQPDPKFKMSIRAGISLTTVNGINVMLKPRQATAAH